MNKSINITHYIFLPGLGCNKTMFDEVVKRINIDKKFLHQYDFGKYGRDYTIYNQDDQIYQKLVQDGIHNENLIFICYSISVFGVIQLESKNLLKIDKLILFSPPIISDHSKYPLSIKILIKLIMTIPGIELFQKTIFRLMALMPGFVLFWDIVGIKYTQNNKIFISFLLKTPLKSMMRAFDDLLRFNFAPYLIGHNTPTKIIRGNKDRVIKKFNGHVHDDLFGNRNTLWVDANHDIPEDFPELSAQIINNEILLNI